MPLWWSEQRAECDFINQYEEEGHKVLFFIQTAWEQQPDKMTCSDIM